MSSSMTAVSQRDDQNESRRGPMYMLSDSDPDTDSGDSDPESEAESEAGPEPPDTERDSHTDGQPAPRDPHELKFAGIKGHGDVDVEGAYRATYTQPKTEGDLYIHSILECDCEVLTCQLNDNGTLLAVGLNDGTIKVYSPDSGCLVKILRDSTSMLSSLPVTGLKFTFSSQDHCLLLATYASGRVRCWHVWGGDCLWGLREVGEGSEGGEGRHTLSLAISPTGDKAATGGSDSAIHLYDLATHQRMMTCRASSTRTVMDGHRLRVFAVAFHPHREREFISGGWDNSIQFWDTRQQNSVRMFYGPHVCGDALQIDPVANHILAGSWRKGSTLEIWDYPSGKKECEVPHDSQGESKIYTCQWLGPDHIMAAGSQANMLRIINRQTMTTESRLYGLSSAVFSSSACLAGVLLAATSGTRVFLLRRGRWRPRKQQSDQHPSGVGML